jgi:hypothetical protein
MVLDYVLTFLKKGNYFSLDFDAKTRSEVHATLFLSNTILLHKQNILSDKSRFLIL